VDNEVTHVRSLGPEALIEALLESAEMKVFLERLVELAGAELSQGAGGAHCSVTVSRSHRPITVCSTDPETAAMDELQYASKQGPCLEAIRSGHQVEVVDFRTETRWPEYAAAMTESGMRSVLAVPIVPMTSAGAALNCYSPGPGPVSEEVRNALLAFTKVAARAVSFSVKLQAQTERAADLAAAMESRSAINLASGVIMAQTGCGQRQAVDILMRASSNRNVKLRDVALSVLARFEGAASTTRFDSF